MGEIIIPTILPPKRFPRSVLSILKGFVSPMYKAVDILAPTTPPILPPFSTTCGTRERIPGKAKKRLSFVLSIMPDIAESNAHMVSIGTLSLTILAKEYLSLFVLNPIANNPKRKSRGREFKEMGGKNFNTTFAEIRMARIVTISPNMGRIGAITLSGSMSLLKKRTVRKKTKGIRILEDIKALNTAIRISLTTPTEPMWMSTEKPWARNPRNTAIPMLREKETKMFSLMRDESLNTGFINPT